MVILDPPPPPPAMQEIQLNEIEMQKNIQTVNTHKEKEHNIVRIRLKNGKEEVYNIDKIKEKEQMEAKYGKLITAPPPPPPVPAVLNNKGYYLTVADDDGECVVIVKDKNKKIVKAMLLTDWTKAEAENEKKYGKIPPPPPPAPDAPAEVSVVAPVGTTVAVSAPAELSTIANVSTINEVTVTGYGTTATSPVVVEGKQINGKIKSTSPAAEVKEVVVTGYGTSKTAVSSSPKEVTVAGYGTSTSKPATIRLNTKSSDNVLYILDGKEVTSEEVNAISPNDIESVSVLKDENAVKLYGEKGKNGVIIIKTKTKKTSFKFFTTPWKVENEKC